MELSEMKEGMVLPGISTVVTQGNINLYAEASRDFNPIHIDQEFASKTPLGGTIAHGMLILAYISQMMTNVFGKSWLSGGRLNARFKAPARPNDILTVSGKVSRIKKVEGQILINCEISCKNQKKEAVITGEASWREYSS
jgi:acyl dehydratase